MRRRDAANTTAFSASNGGRGSALALNDRQLPKSTGFNRNADNPVVDVIDRQQWFASYSSSPSSRDWFGLIPHLRFRTSGPLAGEFGGMARRLNSTRAD